MSRRRRKHSSPARKQTRAQLVRKVEDLRKIIREMEHRAGAPDYKEKLHEKWLRAEEADDTIISKYRNLYAELSERIHSQIDAIYTAESKSQQRLRSGLSPIFDSPTEFKYRRNSYGVYAPSAETINKVTALKEELHVAGNLINTQSDAERKQLSAELDRDEVYGNRWHDRDFSLYKTRLAEAEGELAIFALEEKKIREKYKVDDTTIAQAAAYEGRTRSEADRIKPVLLAQLRESHECPYCGNALGETPHADHIFPVSLGGLSMGDNMVLVCATCNLQKQDATLREFISKSGQDRAAIESRLEKLEKRF